MNTHDLVGQWKGEFTYGASYGEPHNGTKEKFEITIESADANGFHGRCVDTESATGEYLVTIIKGFFEQGFISFTKEYAHQYEMNEKGEVISNAGKKGHVVNYEGEYIASQNRFEGTWEIHYHFQLLWIRWYTQTFNGTWEMYRE